MTNIRLVQTGDGSRTLFREDLGEHYHSIHGAILESNHVYLEAGFNQCRQSTINVLEIGFGTGLNCFLTAMACRDCGKTVHYYAIENHPLNEETWRELRFGEFFREGDPDLFEALHQVVWNLDCRVNDWFFLRKIEADLLKFDFRELPSASLVYYDAFSPEKQPELWSLELLRRVCDNMEPGGIFVTYCARGEVRRSLQSLGLLVERLPGPPGKREMIRAVKPSN